MIDYADEFERHLCANGRNNHTASIEGGSLKAFRGVEVCQAGGKDELTPCVPCFGQKLSGISRGKSDSLNSNLPLPVGFRVIERFYELVARVDGRNLVRPSTERRNPDVKNSRVLGTCRQKADTNQDR